jgi:Carboxypeptidase regulatory-like domain
VRRTQKTGPSGSFSFDLIPVGDYRLDAEAAGFKKQTLNAIHASVGRPFEVDVQLQVGAASETVKVNAEDASIQVNTQDSSLGNNFVSSQIQQLPLKRAM